MNRRKVRRAKPKRTLPDIVRSNDRHSLAGQLEAFLASEVWNIIKGILAEDIFSHQCLMEAFIKEGHASKAAYECGNVHAFEYVVNEMLQKFIETMRTGKQAGLIESTRPDEETASPSVSGV